jgi:transcriptional regulator with XRE-family HTH domain
LRRSKAKKKLSEADERAAQRAYSIFMERKKEAKIAQKAFLQNHPGLPLPEELNVSQRSVAERVGWTQGNFSQYISGAVPIRESALEKICEALGCQPWDVRPEKYAVPKSDQSLVEAKAFEFLNELIGKIVSNESLDEVPERVKQILKNFIEEEVNKATGKASGFDGTELSVAKTKEKNEKINRAIKEINDLIMDFSKFKNNLAKFEIRLNGLEEKTVSFCEING